MNRLMMPLCLLLSLSTGLSAGELVDATSELELLKADFGLADGPSWNGLDTLFVPDVKGGQIHAFTPENGTWRVVLPEAGRISASCFARGTLYLADNGEAGLSILRGTAKEPMVRNDDAATPPRRPNDLVVDRRGGIYYTLTAASQVMYVSPSGEQQVAIDGLETPNGLTLSPDGGLLYVAAYAPKQVWVYQVTAPGRTDAGRLFATMDDGPEKGADGMTIDSDGHVYCAGASDIWIWSPDGRLVEKLAVPTRPINCTFGDADRKSLYITGFGGVYRQRMRVAGLPPVPAE